MFKSSEPGFKCPTPSCPPGYKVVEKKATKKKSPYLRTMFSTINKKDIKDYVPSKTAGVKGGTFLESSQGLIG